MEKVHQVVKDAEMAFCGPFQKRRALCCLNLSPEEKEWELFCENKGLRGGTGGCRVMVHICSSNYKETGSWGARWLSRLATDLSLAQVMIPGFGLCAECGACLRVSLSFSLPLSHSLSLSLSD